MKEQLLVNTIRNALRGMQMQGRCRYIRNNTGGRTFAKPRPGGGEYRGFVRFGEPGSPDFLVFLPAGRTLHIECKSATGKLRPEQEAWKRDVERLGHVYVVVRTRAEFEGLMAVHGGEVGR
jgi:hypothetical protein